MSVSVSTQAITWHDQVLHPIEGAHLGELLTYGEFVYVSNSFDSITALRAEPDGGLRLTLDAPPVIGEFVRCSTIALHPGSRTLYCGSEAGKIFAYDLTDPEVPVLRKPVHERISVRDLHVDGDRLLLSRFNDGLWVADIDADGDISEPVAAPIEGNVRHTAGAGDELVALTFDRGLLSLERDGGTYRERAALALGGPPLDVSVRDGRAAVALGSNGVAVVALDAETGELTLEHELRPPVVVTSADLRGQALAVLGLTGLFVYDLETADGPDTLPAGFNALGRLEHAEPGAGISARFLDQGDLAISDWLYIDRMGIDASGVSCELDLPHAVYVSPGSDVALAVRAPCAVEINASVTIGGFSQLVSASAGKDAHVVIPAEWYEAGQDKIVVTPTGTNHENRPYETVDIVVRAGEPGPRPAPGEPFPEVALADADLSVYTLPSDMGDQQFRVIFYASDCVAMWPEMEDAAFLARRGLLDGGATPILVNEDNLGHQDWHHRWGLADMLHGHYESFDTPPEVLEFNAPLTSLYADVFSINELPSAAAHPTDYLVDEGGVVVAVEREYRGAYPLR